MNIPQLNFCYNCNRLDNPYFVSYGLAFVMKDISFVITAKSLSVNFRNGIRVINSSKMVLIWNSRQRLIKRQKLFSFIIFMKKKVVLYS
jgi:hypothetical protein